MLNKIGLSSVAILLSFPLFAEDYEGVKQGDVIGATLHQLKPTQPSVGYDQVYYKLGRFQYDVKKQFDEVCEANGQKGLTDFNSQSHPNIPSSFLCESSVGKEKGDMKTVVIAPDNNLYLTDGHHTFNTFWHMEGGGAAFKVNVVVDQDYRALETMDAFWQQMEVDKNTWLFNQDGEAIGTDVLPTSLGLQNFSNDQYRALMYFSRGVGWDKPKAPVPFLEFYWTKALRENIDLDQFDLQSQAGYLAAIEANSKAILALTDTNLGGSGKSVTEMGQFDVFNDKGLAKASKRNSKLDYMLRYKTASTSNGLAYDKAVNHSKALLSPDEFSIEASHDLMALPAMSAEGTINAIVEIPTGTSAKWELNKDNTNQVIWEFKKGKPRVVNYLGYPGNYGTIPQTALPKEFGGDGDPLDVIVLGQAVPRGEVVQARLIGVLKMLDDGEQDDKLIAVIANDSPFQDVTSMKQLDREFSGVSDIIQLWFSNYKGANGGMEVQGYEEAPVAQEVLQQAMAFHRQQG
ncbi:inorganic diphosphatase [Photobacterium makurazakiensis]|uniref:ParB-like protein n=1 Tax=Photobacterium makurazakiensis TaxID=2910234 RepID=UPI003D0DC652